MPERKFDIAISSDFKVVLQIHDLLNRQDVGRVIDALRDARDWAERLNKLYGAQDGDEEGRKSPGDQDPEEEKEG